MRYLLLLFLLFLSNGARPQAPSPMSAEDQRAVYIELSQTHDGLVYTVHMAGYATEEAARATWAEIQQPRMRGLRLNEIFKNAALRRGYLFTFDPPVRDKLVTLFKGERAGPIRTPHNWVIVELVETRPAPLPPITSVDLPGLVAAGVLPSAEQLRGDANLRKRSAANAVRTLEDLRRAPADLDVNRQLSTGETLLIRALLHGSDDLVAELLKRGADPNRCAYKFCPLHVAALRGERKLAEMLIARGADVRAVSKGTSVLDAAERSENAEFKAWLRGVVQAKQSGK